MSHDDVPLLKALPSPVSDGTAQFQHCMTDLISLVRTHLPDRLVEAGPAPREQRITLRRALGYLDQNYPAELPEEFFEALVQAAVHDPDPSFNRQFVAPVVAAFGRRRTQEALLDILTTGTNLERAGAARAWYWATVEMYEDLWTRWKHAALREFVANDDIDVRRCVLPGLPLHPSEYPEDLHPLVAEAVHIARTHPDDYLRHRVELQTIDPNG